MATDPGRQSKPSHQSVEHGCGGGRNHRENNRFAAANAVGEVASQKCRAKTSDAIRADGQPSLRSFESQPRHIYSQEWQDERAELVQERPEEKNPGPAW